MQDRRLKVQSRINDEERNRKQEEHRLMTRRLFKEQQDALKERADERAQKEVVRSEKVDRKRANDMMIYTQKRQEVQHRILNNLEVAKNREEKRKDDFFEKKDYHERLRAQAVGEMQKDREMKNRENFLMEQKRQLTLSATREKEEHEKELLRRKFEDDEKFVDQMNEVRGKELALTKEREALNKQLKLENVERIKRIQEYKRLETLRKIGEGDERTENMMKRKEEIISQRRIAGLKTKMQKDEILSVLESSRANGGRAIQMLQKVLNPSDNKKKKKKRSNMMERTGSAGATGGGGGMAADDSLGPPPDAPSVRARMAQSDGPSPYKSPYADFENDGGGETVTF
jgi:hypothetical protein